MLGYFNQRVKDLLSTIHTVLVATSGPAGILVDEFPCEAVNLDLVLLVPITSDHLFNLEHDPNMRLSSPGWQMNAHARVISDPIPYSNLFLRQKAGMDCYTLVLAQPIKLEIRGEEGWGGPETIDLFWGGN
jgi:hypothetical protein